MCELAGLLLTLDFGDIDSVPLVVAEQFDAPSADVRYTLLAGHGKVYAQSRNQQSTPERANVAMV